MTDFDDAIGDATTTLLAEAGGTFTYCRGATEFTGLSARKSTMPALQMENGEGLVIEVRPVDFIFLTSSLPYPKPEAGDRITDGTEVWELMPTVGEKVFRQISPQMIRLHTKKVT